MYYCTCIYSLVIHWFSAYISDVPSTVPINVKADTIANTTALITWEAPEDTDKLPVHSYIIYLMNDILPQDQIRTMDNSTSVFLRNLLPGLNYTVVVAAITQRLERLFEGNLSDPLTFTTMNGRKYIQLSIIMLWVNPLNVSEF